MLTSSAYSYRDLWVWQKAMSLAAEAYRLTKALPRSEEYRLTSQLLRAAASVPANIAEGHARGTRKDYTHFISVARGSLAETETVLLLLVEVELLTRRRGDVSAMLRDRQNAEPAAHAPARDRETNP